MVGHHPNCVERENLQIYALRVLLDHPKALRWYFSTSQEVPLSIGRATKVAWAPSQSSSSSGGRAITYRFLLDRV